MENATEALMMAFAVMIFVIALTVSMVAFSNAKATADTILYTKDESNYYEYMGATGLSDENRIVGLETVIPTLYKYYKENYTVVFKKGDYIEETGRFENWENLYVYETKANRNWQASYKNLMNRKYNINDPSNKIFSFDLDEETLRHEPWSGSNDRAKNNLDCFLKGDTYLNPNFNQSDIQARYIDYSKSPLGVGGFIGKYKNKQFIETITEYNPKGVQEQEGKYSSSLTKEKSKRMVIFTVIN